MKHSLALQPDWRYNLAMAEKQTRVRGRDYRRVEAQVPRRNGPNLNAYDLWERGIRALSEFSGEDAELTRHKLVQSVSRLPRPQQDLMLALTTRLAMIGVGTTILPQGSLRQAGEYFGWYASSPSGQHPKAPTVSKR